MGTGSEARDGAAGLAAPSTSGERVEAVGRFPDQNPNPVMRLGSDGRLVYANQASAGILSVWGVEVGQRPGDEVLSALRSAAADGRRVELEVESLTFELLPVDIADMGFINVYGTDVTARKAVIQFPDQNPNPVLRITWDGTLVYANRASDDLTAGLGTRLGEPIPEELRNQLLADVGDSARPTVEVEAGGRTYALLAVDVPAFGFINVYGTDVTARNAVIQFPDQNPNPVLRITWDGGLVYANRASTALTAGLGVQIGVNLPNELRDRLLARLSDPGEATVEIESAGRSYVLKPVDVPAFGFINVYGTDITATRQLEALHLENERLLLNVLPEPIADRLRAGEKLIADRFDDATLLFADIVEFTRLSSGMSADELVTVLNDVFSLFDELVDVHGLEKVKTIGDAYMVVGGIPEPSADHTKRCALLALEITRLLDDVEAARRLGIRFRIGLHSGPVVAGVIGTKKFIYDVWGDTVNLASRMESLGVPGRIQVTGAVEERLRDGFVFEPRGPIEVKGKGLLPTWFLTG